MFVNVPEVVKSDYACLLGLFLGDGCLSRFPRTWRLTVSLDAAYPGIVHRCRSAMATVAPGRRISVLRCKDTACVVVQSYWSGWPEWFPQHGPGRKHERSIVLADWQEEIVRCRPWEFLRGLLESDGCRSINRINRVHVTLPSGRRAVYEYPRWYFVNASEDILQIFGAACELVEIRWTRSRRRMITVSNRNGVALLDRHVGPKM